MKNQHDPGLGSSTWRGGLLGLALFRPFGMLHMALVAAYFTIVPVITDTHVPINDAQGLDFALHLLTLLVAGLFLGGVFGLIPALVLGFAGGGLVGLLLDAYFKHVSRLSACLAGGLLTGILASLLYGLYWKPWLSFLFPLWPEAGLGRSVEFFTLVTLPGLVYALLGARLGHKLSSLANPQS
jgi:hypothetical protein